MIEVAGETNKVLKSALRCLAGEYDDPHAHSDAEAEYATEQLALAALALVESIHALPPGGRPVGWPTG